MIVLVVNVSTKAQGKSNNASSSTNTESDLLQIEDRFNGNSQQDAPVDIGMFPRELKGNFSAVVESRIGISSADRMLLDSPPAVVLRNYEKCLPDMKKLSEFASLVIEFLKQNRYLKSDYRVTVDRILRDENISEFFFNYYEQARSALQNIISSEFSGLQSIHKENVPVKYVLFTFNFKDQTNLMLAFSKFSESVESVRDRVIFCCPSLKCSFLLIKLITVENHNMAIDLSSNPTYRSFSVFSTPTEVNEQLFPLFAIDVISNFYLTLSNILTVFTFLF
jgi:hypothetical protein